MAFFVEKRYSAVDDYWYQPMGGVESSSGVKVSEESSITMSAVWRCVTLLSSSAACLPSSVYRRMKPRGRQRIDGPLYRALHGSPNPEMSKYVYIQTLFGHLLTWGNAYVHVVWGPRGVPVELWPMRPDQMCPERTKSGELQYVFTRENGSKIVFSAGEIMHIPGFSFNGLVGFSPVGVLRNAIGLGLATEQFGSHYFSNGAHPGGIIEHPGKLSTEGLKSFKESARQSYSGLSKSHKLMVLEEGLKYHQVGIPPDDSQFLETRKFQNHEVARIYGVPPHLIGEMDRATFSNIEEQGLEYVIYALQPVLCNFESQANRRLLRDSASLYFKFNIKGLLRGNSEARAKFYKDLYYLSALSPNDIRELEDENPIEGGDVYFQQTNVVPLGTEPVLPAAPKDDDSEDDEEPDDEEQNSREQRTINQRRAKRRAHEPAMLSVFDKLLRAEAREINKAAKKHLETRDAESFEKWLRKYYNDHPGFVEKTITSAFLAYGRDIHSLAAAEVGAALDPDFKDFVRGYVSTVAVKHSARSRRQVEKVIEKGIPGITALMGRWIDSRAASTARREVVEADGAFATATYVSAGRTLKRWQASGENCPYCDELDGRVVGVTQKFMKKGDSLNPEGAEAPLVSSGDRGHPPIHEGCDCGITAG